MINRYPELFLWGNNTIQYSFEPGSIAESHIMPAKKVQSDKILKYKIKIDKSAKKKPKKK